MDWADEKAKKIVTHCMGNYDDYVSFMKAQVAQALRDAYAKGWEDHNPPKVTAEKIGKLDLEEVKKARPGLFEDDSDPIRVAPTL